MKSLSLRKILATTLAGALLSTQQGVVAFAAVVSVPQTVASPVGFTGAAGSAVGSLSLTPGSGLTSQNPLGPSGLVGVLPGVGVSPSIATVKTALGAGITAQGSAAAAAAVVTPRARLSAVATPAVGSAVAEKAAAVLPSAKPGTEKSVAAMAQLSSVGSAVAEKNPSLTIGRFFDGDALRKGAIVPVGAELSGRESRASLRSGLGLFRGKDAGAESQVPVPAATSFSDAVKDTKVFITRAGRQPVAVELSALGAALAADPAILQEVNKNGRIRVVLGKDNPRGGLTKADIEAVQAMLASYGVQAKLETETIPVDWSRKPKTEGDSASSGSAQSQAKEHGRAWRWIIGPITAPFREAAYLGRTFWASVTKPTTGELIGGLVSKAFPSVVTVGVWAGMYAGFPVAMAAALGVSLALNLFHGVMINTWSNFQNNMGKQRGLRYLTVFNFIYGQFWGALFRTIAWTVIPKTIPPWSPMYWRDIGLATVIGTFCGSLGMSGLNALYDKGLLTRFQRSIVQQVRDLLMCLAGTYLGAGSMMMFWTLFAVQQVMDVLIYTISQRVKKRPILYVADADTAASPEFQDMYPVTPGSAVEKSPLRQALEGLAGSPFVKPFILLFKKLRQLLSGKKSS
ncbi:MAG TPA: hypothetical protein DD417_08185 [Elusimicrobia bacterium]|nr:hypothetical protein [Elusimicrobiota bacterium]